MLGHKRNIPVRRRVALVAAVMVLLIVGILASGILSPQRVRLAASASGHGFGEGAVTAEFRPASTSLVVLSVAVSGTVCVNVSPTLGGHSMVMLQSAVSGGVCSSIWYVYEAPAPSVWGYHLVPRSEPLIIQLPGAVSYAWAISSYTGTSGISLAG